MLNEREFFQMEGMTDNKNMIVFFKALLFANLIVFCGNDISGAQKGNIHFTENRT